MLLETIQKLINYPTVSHDQEENKNALKWIKKELEGLPVYFEDVVSDGFSSLVVATRKTKKPKIWLQAHIDVVEGSHRVFEHRLEGDILYGRGTYDMKFAIACYIKLFKEISDKLSEYDMAIVITSDEEIGGTNGTLALLEDGYRAKVSILPDAGYSWKIERAAKGGLGIYVKARGKATHGSRPWEGKNAIFDMLGFIDGLRKEFPEEPCGDDEHAHDTFSVNKIIGGTAGNKIPHKAEAWLEVRYMPESTIEDIREKIESHAKRFERITVEYTTDIKPLRVDRDNQYVKSFQESAYEILGCKLPYCVSHGASDARFLAQYRIPAIVVAPEGGGHHSENEWIDVKDMERFYEVLRGFVEKEAKEF